MQRWVTEPGYTDDYDYTYLESFDPDAEVSYYTENNGMLTSGYHFRIYDRDAIDFISGQSYTLFVYTTAMEDQWKSKDGAYKGWYTEEDKPYLKMTFTDSPYPFVPADADKTSPDTGISDIAAISGLALIAAGTALTAKKRR